MVLITNALELCVCVCVCHWICVSAERHCSLMNYTIYNIDPSTVGIENWIKNGFGHTLNMAIVMYSTWIESWHSFWRYRHVLGKHQTLLASMSTNWWWCEMHVERAQLFRSTNEWCKAEVHTYNNHMKYIYVHCLSRQSNFIHSRVQGAATKVKVTEHTAWCSATFLLYILDTLYMHDHQMMMTQIDFVEN